jgi:hypothetical protein
LIKDNPELADDEVKIKARIKELLPKKELAKANFFFYNNFI